MKSIKPKKQTAFIAGVDMRFEVSIIGNIHKMKNLYWFKRKVTGGEIIISELTTGFRLPAYADNFKKAKIYLDSISDDRFKYGFEKAIYIMKMNNIHYPINNVKDFI